MSMSDIIADTLTRIRNAQAAGHDSVDVNTNRIVEDILKILQKEGYIANAISFTEGPKKMAKVELRYYNNKPVIRGIDRISKPGRRVYQSSAKIRPALNNIGLNIFSTSKGVISGKEAKSLNVGGEYLCKVW